MPKYESTHHHMARPMLVYNVQVVCNVNLHLLRIYLQGKEQEDLKKQKEEDRQKQRSVLQRKADARMANTRQVPPLNVVNSGHFSI